MIDHPLRQQAIIISHQVRTARVQLRELALLGHRAVAIMQPHAPRDPVGKAHRQRLAQRVQLARAGRLRGPPLQWPAGAVEVLRAAALEAAADSAARAAREPGVVVDGACGVSFSEVVRAGQGWRLQAQCSWPVHHSEDVLRLGALLATTGDGRLSLLSAPSANAPVPGHLPTFQLPADVPGKVHAPHIQAIAPAKVLRRTAVIGGVGGGNGPGCAWVEETGCPSPTC